MFHSECDNHFGPNCKEKCNTTCKSCNSSTGVCSKDCHPGWRGLFFHERMFFYMNYLLGYLFSIYQMSFLCCFVVFFFFGICFFSVFFFVAVFYCCFFFCLFLFSSFLQKLTFYFLIRNQ